MLKDIVSKKWDEVMASEFDFKSNTGHHVVELGGEELGYPAGSLIVLYYNLYTGTFMAGLIHYDGHGFGIVPEELPGFIVSIKEEVDLNGDAYTQVEYVQASLREALTE